MNTPRLTLGEIGRRHGSDKFTRHRYGGIYEYFLEPLRDSPLKLLEIGIGGENLESGGGSLIAWRDYLPNAEIFGIDIYDKSFLAGERVHTFICNQAEPEDLNRLCDKHGPFDIIIDDGSHRGPDVASALFTLFPRLRAGGIYFIEDTQTSYWPQYNGSSLVPNCYDTAIRWTKLAVDLINRGEILDPSAFPLAANIDISELHVYHNISVLVRRPEGHLLESNIITEKMRADFLAADLAMHGDISSLHMDLAQDPALFRALLKKVVELGGLKELLRD